MEDYISCLSNLREISMDTAHDEVMTELLLPTYNFDKVKCLYTNQLLKSEESCSSCDGILWGQNLKVLIEFKNGNKIQRKDIHLKILNSLLILCDINSCSISDLRTELIFILVYNEENNPITSQEIRQYENQCNDEVQESINRNIIGRYFCKMAKSEFVRYDLLKYKGLYFKDVHSYNQYEFESWICERLSNCIFGII